MKFDVELPNQVTQIISELENHGYEAYVVGGAVRDIIMKRSPHDYDICTSATPDKMKEVFGNKRAIDTGLKHGTITVIEDDMPIEVTTFRIDGSYSDNRRPDNVTFTASLVEDLKRRDFTINAMAYNPNTGLVDPFNGIDDITDKVIRCVGSAKERFSEDALRMLRAIRFAANLNFTVDYDTECEIHNQYERLSNVSIERINSEFCKIVCCDDFSSKLNQYSEVFSLFIPELKYMIGFDQKNPYHEYDAFTHTIKAVENCSSKDLIVRLAVFFHDFGKPHCYQDGEDGVRHFKGHGKISADITDSIMHRLRFDNDTRNKVVELVYYHDANFVANKRSIKKWLNKIGEVQFRRLIELRKADIIGHRVNYDKKLIDDVNNILVILSELLNENECFSLKDLLINGDDIKEMMMIREGKEVGYWLNIILQKVIDGELDNNRDQLIRWIVNINDKILEG